VSAPGRLGEHARAAGLRIVRPWEAEDNGGRGRRKKGEPPPPPKREQAGRCPSCRREKSWLRPGEVCAPCRVGRAAAAPLRLDEDDGPAIAPRPVPPRLEPPARVVEPAPAAVEPAQQPEQSEEVRVGIAGQISTCPVCGKRFEQTGVGRSRVQCSRACTIRAAGRRKRGAPIADGTSTDPAAEPVKAPPEKRRPEWAEGLSAEAMRRYRTTLEFSRSELGVLLGAPGPSVDRWERELSVPPQDVQERLRALIAGPPPKRPLRGPDAPAPEPEPVADVAPAPDPAPAVPAPRPSLRRAALGALAAFARAAAGRLVAIGTAAEEASR
jgi:DNA-binding transcriptional regulator YiaG